MTIKNKETRVKHTPRVSDLVTWGAIITHQEPTVILNNDGCYMTTLTYTPQDMDMLEEEERAHYIHRLEALLSRFGSGWALLADQWHMPARAYPHRTFDNAVAQFLDRSRQAIFDAGVLHENTFYLTLLWQPPSVTKEKWYEGIFTTHHEHTDSADARNLEAFLHALVRWSDQMQSVFSQWKWCNADETCTYLHQCVSWDHHLVTAPESPVFLGQQLTDSYFLKGHTPQLGKLIEDPGYAGGHRLERFLRPLCMKSWPSRFGYTVAKELNMLPFPFRFTARYIALDKGHAETVLHGLQEKWIQLIWGKNRFFAAQTADAQKNATSIEQELDKITWADVGNHGYFTPTVTVWGATREELDYREREASKILQGRGFVVFAETINACQAWQATLPGDTDHNVRAPLLSSLTLAAFFPNSNAWEGQPWDQHFQAPALFTTSSQGHPFSYSIHQGEIGLTLLIGRTRSGKSALMAFMAMMFLAYKAKPQVFLFDNKLSMYCATKMVDGVHYDLGAAHTLGFQPLGRVDEGDKELRWAQSWLEDLFAAQDFVVTAREKEEIWVALQRVALKPSHLRTLTTFCACFQVQRLKSALSAFLQGGQYAFFDAAEDSFHFETWTCFELQHLLALPGAIPHALSYFFHRMDACFTGQPTFVVLDELYKYMENPVFAARLLEWIHSVSKLNVSVLFALHDLAAVSKSPLFQALLGSCQTKIALPNSMADTPGILPYYQACGYTESQVSIIADATEHQDYFYTSPEGSRLFQLRLSPLERLLCAASSLEEIAALRALDAEHRDVPLAVSWLRDRGYDIEAGILQTQYYGS